MRAEELEKLLGYKKDNGEYKHFRSYHYEYHPFCLKNKISSISREKFMEHIRATIDKEKAQKFMDLMHKGYKLGAAQKEVEFSDDEVSVTMDASIVTNSYFGKKVKL